MDWQINTKGWIEIENQRFRAAFGRSGAIDQSDKCEGDGATPLGRYILRNVIYRSDRIEQPNTRIPIRSIRPDDGWCDAPEDPAYNRPVRLPYPASTETLTRKDGLYDIIIVLGHNDNPPVPGMGSAIFLHCKRGDYEPTEGCVALDPTDVCKLLELARPGDYVVIS